MTCHFKVPLSSQEQADLQQVTQIPPGDYPHGVIAVGGIPLPITLRVSKEAGETRLDGEGGTPPYRVLRSESNEFSNPTVLAESWPDTYYIDYGTLGDGRNYYYDIEWGAVPAGAILVRSRNATRIARQRSARGGAM